MDLKEKIKSLPVTPGVYMMKGQDGGVLYVGKANNIRKRVSSYFYPNRMLGLRIRALVRNIEDISYLPTATEAEALIYENGLIKQLSPRYNVALRDDKSYPMLKLTAQEEFPRLFITRQKKDDGSIYYGPYTDARLLRQALIELRKLFPLRSCGKMPKSICLNYHIKQCLAPCAGKIDRAGYVRIISELKLFLEGRRPELIKVLSGKMADASSARDFEEASRLKKMIEALISVKENAVSYNVAGELEELKAVIGMKVAPNMIEAFDVSNTMGKDAVGSMVSFYKGRPRKSGYRKFKIKSVSTIDDYGMMREIVRRRYVRVVGEGTPIPDLILIDGGKGHLSAAKSVLEEIGLSCIPVIGIAKEFEHIYAGNKEPVVLPEESKALHLLKRVRDEAHRFAISYHKSLLSKKVRVSELDRIPSIGPGRKRELMRRFGNIENIKNASLKDLLETKGMNEKTAKNIVEYFKVR